MNQRYDVAIIGGGPSGSTAGAILKKYDPALRVAIFERESFPRDHIGESQLPPISLYLDEMGCWDKVEAANFPIKIGATYRWGRTPELWDFDFVPVDQFVDEARPAKFEGYRRSTAFQVDRSVYDKILLDHAAELGCEVRQPAKVMSIQSVDGRVEGLSLDSGEQVTAEWYLDASGRSGILRRALGVETEVPTSLQNVAVWDYWQDASWAVSIGSGGTRIQIYSLPYGWIWFIPVGPTRTSIGLVMPVAHFKSSGQKLDELYAKALQDEPIIRKLLTNARREGKTETTTDWSFLAKRQCGPNWMLIGESGGFADPILSAGMSLAQAAGREAAYTILESKATPDSREWLLSQFETRQEGRIRNHIRFADYWYTANAQFVDLQEFTAQIARDNGLELAPDKAWAWLAQGGFINEDVTTGAGGYSLSEIKRLGDFLGELDPSSALSTNNTFRLNLSGATWSDRAQYEKGRVLRSESYTRGGRVLPMYGAFAFLVDVLQRDSKIEAIVERIRLAMEPYRSDPKFRTRYISEVLQAFEGMISDGWIEASLDPSRPVMDLAYQSTALHWNVDNVA